ncbi:tetratricopeptide repeat protein [Leucothrix sargassi]|nr:tetratricopeptide repeat protein [Leucothrix sargassi]
MIQRRLLVRSLSLSMAAGLSLTAIGCQGSDMPVAQSEAPKPTPVIETQSVSTVSVDDKMYHTLAAEMHRLQGDDANATLHYSEIVEGSQDEALLKVATESAAQSEYLDIAVRFARHWLSISSDEVEPRQYLALLLLRSSEYAAAAAEMHAIEQEINEAGHDGLAFVTSLVSLESHKDQAFRAFEIYVTDFNRTTSAHLKLADLALKQQGSESALTRLNELNKELSNQEEEASLVLRSKALHRQGDVEGALKIMQGIIDTGSVEDVTRLEYARLLMLSNQEVQATNQLEAVYLNTPTNLEVLKSLVGLRISQGQFQQAEQYAIALSKDEVHASVAHHYLAEIHESRNELDEAIREYGQVENGSYFDSAQQRISELLVEQYSLAIATKWLSESRQNSYSDERKFLYWRLEAKLRSRYGKEADALEAYRQAYQLNPTNNRMNYQYAMTAQRAGDIALAETLLLEMTQRNPADADAFNALGYMLLESGERLDDAETYITKAYELNPNDAIIIDSLGWLYYKQGKINDAASLLMSAYQMIEDPEIATHLIEVLLKQGQTQEATALLSKVMEQYPNDEDLISIKKKL